MPHPETEAILNKAFPMRGPCGICARGWARHRECDGVRGAYRAETCAGHRTADMAAALVALEYDYPLEAVKLLVSLNGSAYSWWLRSEARATGEGKAACYDCGLPYDDPGFCDLVVPPTIWEQISPNREHPEGGLLCPTCLCRALVKAGVQQTAGRFTSGPLAMPSAEDQA